MTSPFGSTSVPTQYQPIVIASAAKWGISPALLAAQIDAESSFNPNSVSSAGAVGIAQFLPSTAKEWGVNPYDVNSAIDGMAHLDSVYLQRFGSIDKALAAYNAGPGAVEKYGGVPPYAETQNYVRRILAATGASAVTNGQTIPANGLQLELASNGSGSSTPGISQLVHDVIDPQWWKRVGVVFLGLSIILGGVYFMLKKQGYRPEQAMGKVIDYGKHAIGSAADKQ